MLDALDRAAQAVDISAPIVEWMNVLQSVITSIPSEITISEIIAVVREQRAIDLAVILQCKECGKNLPPSLRKTNHSKICKECRESKKSRYWSDERLKKQKRDFALWESNRGSDSFRFHYLCAYGDLDICKNGLKSLPYKEFLETVYWNVVKNYVKYRQGRKCSLCASINNLNVHHKTYVHHGEEHKYLDDLILICRSCHAKFHDKFDEPEATELPDKRVA